VPETHSSSDAFRSLIQDLPLQVRIGWDATYAIGRELSGVGQYSLRVMKELERLYPEVEWRRYYRSHRLLRAPWPKRLLLERGPGGLAVFHGLNQRLPLASSSPCVATYHDLFVLSNEYSSPEFRARFAVQAKEAAQRSARIIAVSDFTARQVASLLDYPAGKVRVVPHGVDAAVELGLPREKIVLSVGAIQKRKNTRRLIEAFLEMPEPWRLVLAGSQKGFEAEAMLAGLDLRRVKLLGYVSDEDLKRLYQTASIFAFPSLDEGFGIPVLEAMAHGLPVLASNTSSLPEVCGDAALLVDPLDTGAIAAGLKALVGEYPSQAGLKRAQLFSWENAARKTAAVYAELIEDLRPTRS
jgi:glycosyltransferase involved in cell wall biosynthesis